MGWIVRSSCWSAVVAGLLLPMLSVNGYGLSTDEFMIVAAACVAAGLLLGAFSRWRPVNAALVLAALVLFASQYLASPPLWHEHAWLPFALALAIGAFAYASVLFPREMLVVVAAGAGMHAVSSVLFSPPMLTTTARSPTSPPSGKGPVLHFVLDEHAGIAAIPGEAMTPAAREEFLARYVERGFLVFTHAFTADTFTSTSLARLFNPSAPAPKSLVKDLKDPSGWALQRGELLEQIGASREVMVFGSAVVDLTPAVKGIPNATFVQHLRPTHVGPEHLRASFAWAERVNYAFARGLIWLRADFGSPIYWIAMRYFPLQYHEFGLDTRLLYLDMAFSTVERSDHGAWYAFIHVLLPHSPFIYDSACRLRPTGEWHSRHPSFTAAWRLERYAVHAMQAQCASQRLMLGLDALAKRADWAEAAVLVHGDHGSRLTTADREAWPALENAKSQMGRDIYATFLAVRLPGATRGAVIDTPVRVDDVFHQLVKADFRSLDTRALPARAHPFE